jgi:hypothetical protein
MQILVPVAMGESPNGDSRVTFHAPLCPKLAKPSMAGSLQ